MKQIEMDTDDARPGNPGPGGWSTQRRRVHAGNVLHEKQLSGCTQDATNNIMELVAAIHGFETLKEPCEVMVYSDSQYLLGLMRGNRARANAQLMDRLRQAMEPHTVQTTKVLAHWFSPIPATS